MKKLLLGLGTLATIVAPIAAVVSCSTGTHTNKKDDGVTPGSTNNNGAKFINVEESDSDAEAIHSLANLVNQNLPTLANDEITNVERNGNLIRVTYSPETSSDEAEDEGNVSMEVITRVTIKFAEKQIIKIETKAGDYDFNDVTALMKTTIDTTNATIKNAPVTSLSNTQQLDPHDEAIKTTKDAISRILELTNYDMEDTEIDSLVNYMVGADGDVPLTFDGVNPGVKNDETHGKNDYMILFKGAPARVLEGDEWSEKVADDKSDGNQVPVLMRWNPDDHKQIAGVGAQLDPEDKTIEAKWGVTTAEVKQAKFVLYLQTDETQDVTTCQLCEVVMHDGEHYELDTLKDTMKNRVDPTFKRNEAFNFDFALHEFTAKEIGSQLSSSVKNGDDVKHAFANHLTYGEMLRTDTQNTDGASLDTIQDWKTLQSFISTLPKDTKITEDKIKELLNAIDTFNNKKVNLPEDLDTGALDAEKSLMDNYAGKTIKAVLFFQDGADNIDENGAATYISNVSDNVQDVNDAKNKNLGFDSANSSHRILDNHFGIRFDLVD